MFNNLLFFENLAVYENVGKYGRIGQATWRVCFACWINKSRIQTHTQNTYCVFPFHYSKG